MRVQSWSPAIALRDIVELIAVLAFIVVVPPVIEQHLFNTASPSLEQAASSPRALFSFYGQGLQGSYCCSIVNHFRMLGLGKASQSA